MKRSCDAPDEVEPNNKNKAPCRPSRASGARAQPRSPAEVFALAATSESTAGTCQMQRAAFAARGTCACSSGIASALCAPTTRPWRVVASSASRSFGRSARRPTGGSPVTGAPVLGSRGVAHGARFRRRPPRARLGYDWREPEVPWMSKSYRSKAHFVEEGGDTSCSRLVRSTTNPEPLLAPFKCTWVALREGEHLCAFCLVVHPESRCACTRCTTKGKS